MINKISNLNALFYPKSIAIIGASDRKGAVGNDVVKNLVKQGYRGKIYPVNPKITSLYGLKVYPEILDVKNDIDLVVMAVPAPLVPILMRQAAQKDVKAAIVISAGFKEIGQVELEQELIQICLENQIVLVGPNCLGMINPEIKMNASFARRMPEKGQVAFMSQSGALCTAVLDYAEDMGLGFSKFISLGNKADVDEETLIKYLAEDKQTKVIAIYVEELKNAYQLIHNVRHINQGPNPKPIIVLKSGRTEEGAGAIASHTGSLAGGDNAYQALFDQSGMIRANSIKELFDLVQVFSKNELCPVDNVAIITNAGGPGVLTTDAAVSAGLKLAELSVKTIKELQKVLPPACSTHNPIDVLGDAQSERYRQTLKIVEQDPQVDSILVLLTPQSMTEIEKTAEAIIEVKRKSKKAFAVSFMGRPSVKSAVKMLGVANIATSSFPEPAAQSLGAFAKFSRFTRERAGKILSYDDVDRDFVAHYFQLAKDKNRPIFPESEAIEILKAYKFPILKSYLACSDKEAERIAQKINDKIVMKIASPDILHKSDVGGVMLNVQVEEVKEKYNALIKTVGMQRPKARLEGVLMMPMAPKGLELILGVKKDHNLGNILMVGLGGIYVEVFKDVSFAFTPLTLNDAKRILHSLKARMILEGTRGQKGIDFDQVIECIGRLSQLVTDFPQIVELDINPLLALPKGQGAKVLDARLVIN